MKCGRRTRLRFENYHRGIKQLCLIERAQVRSCRAWRNEIGLCLGAFLRLESHCYHKGISWYEAKTVIIREAVGAYIAHPLYSLINCVTSIQIEIDLQSCYVFYRSPTDPNSSAAAGISQSRLTNFFPARTTQAALPQGVLLMRYIIGASVAQASASAFSLKPPHPRLPTKT